jgi:hypothetical protein
MASLHAETVLTVLARCIRPQKGTERWDERVDLDLIEYMSASPNLVAERKSTVSASKESPLLLDPVSGAMELGGRCICKEGWVLTLSKNEER